MRKAALTLFILLAGLTLSAVAVDALQSDWSAGGGVPGPVDHWGRKFDTETNIDYAGTSGDLSLTFPDPQSQIMTLTLEQPYSIAAASIDADGDMDIVICNDSFVDWFENRDGVGTSWDFHSVVWAGAQYVETADVDGDGDNDIIYATSGSIGWRANDGSGGGWTNHSLGSASGVTSIFTGDIDGDGDVDVVGALGTSGAVTWWSNNDGVGGSWTSHPVATGFTGAAGVCLADVDGDSDLDVIAGGGSSVAWWSNDDGAGTSWTQHLVYTGQDISSVAAADLDGDTDIDIAATSYAGNSLIWFSNDDGAGGAWTSTTLQNDFTGAKAVKVADFDGDSDMDLAAAAGGAGEVAWWENTAGDGSAFTKHALCADFGGACSVCGADVNGDAVVDVISCATDVSEARWWNTAPPEPSGVLVSSILDVTADTEWGWAIWNADTPNGTDVGLAVRASDDTADMGTWSENLVWGSDLADLYPTMQSYLQYQVQLTTQDLEVTPTFMDVTMCPYFHLLSPANGAVLETLTPMLDWDDTLLPDFASYTLWWGTDPTFSSYNEVPGIVDSTYTITSGIVNGDVIYWRVKALDASAREVWAPEQDWSFSVDMGGGIDLVDFGADPGDDGVLVTWRFEGEELAGVRVLRESDDGIIPLHHDALPGAATRFLDRNVEPGTDYSYWLEATEADGTVRRFGPTEAVTITEDAPELALYAAYPNPSREVINFVYSIPADGRVTLSVYDLSGRRIATPVNAELTAGRHETSWNCGEVPSGVYLYRLETGAGALTQRLVVSR